MLPLLDAGNGFEGGHSEISHDAGMALPHARGWSARPRAHQRTYSSRVRSHKDLSWKKRVEEDIESGDGAGVIDQLHRPAGQPLPARCFVGAFP